MPIRHRASSRRTAALAALAIAVVLSAFGFRSLRAQLADSGSGAVAIPGTGTGAEALPVSGSGAVESVEEPVAEFAAMTRERPGLRVEIAKSALIAGTEDLESRLRVGMADAAGHRVAIATRISSTRERYELSIRPTGTVRPGTYLLTGVLEAPSRAMRRILLHAGDDVGDTELFSREVSWGELAWNVDREYSLAGTEAGVHAALLGSDRGVDCSADISVEVRDPDGESVRPSMVSFQECGDPSSTFDVVFPMEREGEYAMTITASTGSIVRTTSALLTASAEPALVQVRREAPTVAVAGGDVPMAIRLTPSRSFKGTIVEHVPEGWVVTDIAPEATVTDGTVVWSGTWAKGRESVLSYVLHPTVEQAGSTEWGTLSIAGTAVEEPEEPVPASSSSSTDGASSATEASSDTSVLSSSSEMSSDSSSVEIDSPDLSSSSSSSAEESSVSSSDSEASSAGVEGEASAALLGSSSSRRRSFLGDLLGYGEPVSFDELRSWEAVILVPEPSSDGSVASSEASIDSSSSIAAKDAETHSGSVLSLQPLSESFPANVPATFTLLEGDLPELPGEEGATVSDEAALGALVNRLVSDEDVARAVVKSAILDQKAMIAGEIVSDTASMNDLREAFGEAGSIRRSDVVESRISDVIGTSDVLREKLADTVIDHEPELLTAVSGTIDDDTRRTIVRAAVEAMSDGRATLNDATEAVAVAAEELPVQTEISQAISDTVRADDLQRGPLVESIAAETAQAPQEEPLFSVRLKDRNGKTFEPEYHFEKGSVVLAVEPERRFAPGIYTLVVTIRNPLTGDIETIEQDFAWGVLAMNPNQDRYVPGDTARIDIGVLDDQGFIVCNADLSLRVTSPSGEVTLLSTEDRSIDTGSSCGTKSAENVSPDYAAFMTFPEAGTYRLHLEARTVNGTRSLDQRVAVQEYSPVVISRVAATRLWPFGVAPMTVKVKFYEDYAGTIVDTVPGGFVVSDPSPNAVVAPADTGSGTTITWKGSWSAGETATFRYGYDAPNESPQFFLAGPLRVGDLEELRSWQIANDAAKTWDGGGATNNCSTAANWSGDTIPTTTDDIILDGTSTKAMTWDSGCPSTVASWTQSSGYTNTVTVSITNLTVSGNMSIADGTFTAPSGTLTMKGSFTQTAGTFSHNNGTVLLAPTGVRSLTLSAASTFNNLTLDSGLMQYWKLDDLTGTKARDSSRTRTHATFVGSPTWSGSHLNTGPKYYNPGALKTVAASQYITATVTSQAVNTVSLWFKTTSTINTSSACQNLIQFNGGQNIALGNCTTTTGLETIGMYSDTVSHFSYASPTISPGWHHIVFTYAGGGWNAYIDGTWYGGSPSPASFGTHAYALTSVTSESVGHNITGVLDDVRIYSRALVDSEVKRLYAGNKSTGSGTYLLGGSLTVNGNLGIYDGTLDVSPANYSVTVKGNADLQGDFITRAGAFIMNGTGPQTLSGSTIFNSFSITASSARTAYMDFTSRQSVSGSLVLQGAVSNNLSLRSTKIGSGARILYDADSTQLAADIQYVSVKDSYASGGQALVCSNLTEGCIDNGNNRNWTIQTSTISGTVYADLGTTPVASPTVGLTINGAPYITTTANSSGQFTFSNVSMTGGTVLGFFVSGNTTKAATIVVGSGSSMTGIDLYGNTLIVRSEPGTIPVTSALLKIAGNGGGSDMAAVYDVNSSNDLALAGGKSLYVRSGVTYTPGGRISAADLRNYGTMTMGTNKLTLTGSLITDTGTFTTSTGTILQPRNASNALDLGSNSLGNLTIDNGLVGHWKLDDRGGTLMRDSSRYRNNGTLNGTAPLMWSGANLSSRLQFYNPSAVRFNSANNNATVPHSSSLTFTSAMSISMWAKLLGSQATGTCGGAPSTSQYALYKRNANPAGGGYAGYAISTSPTAWGFGMCTGGTCYGANSTTAPVVGSWVHVVAVFTSGTLKIYVNGALEGTAAGPAAVQDRGEPLVFGRTNFCGQYSGDYDALFNGMIDDIRMYNRELTSSEVSTLYAGNKNVTTHTLGTNATIAGKLDMFSAGIDMNGKNLSVSGNMNIQGNLIPNGGTVTLNGSNPQTISGSTVFTNLTKTVSAASTLFLDYTSRQSISGALILRGAASNLLSIRSTKTGSGSPLLLDGDSGSQTVDYVNVRDNDASGGQTILCDTISEGCLSGGNVTNWQIYTNTISGTVYTDQGTTRANAPSVRLAINGNVYGTATADSNGNYAFSNVAMTGGSVLALYTVGSTPAVTVVSGLQSVMTNLDLYGNTLIARNEDAGTPITNAQLRTGASGGMSDVSAVYAVNSNNDLTLASGKSLYVHSGKSYVPGGRVRAANLTNLGTLTMGTYGLTLTGSFITSSGTFTTSTGTLLTSAATSQALNLGGNSLASLTIDNGLLGYWKLDDGIGTVARDSSRYGRNGVATSPVWSGSVLPSRMQFYDPSSLQLNGSSTYVEVSSNADYNLSASDFTISAWIKTTQSSLGTFFSVRDTSGADSGILSVLHINATTAGKVGFDTWNWSSNRVTGTTTVNDGAWHLVTATYKSSTQTATVYVDGVSDATRTQSGNATSTNRTLRIGANIGSAGSVLQPFNGAMDDVRMYSRALSANEVAALYNGNKNTGSGKYVLDGNVTVAGDLRVYSGELRTAGNNVSVSGNMNLQGDLSLAGGTLTLNGAGVQTVSGSTVFSNLSKTVSAASTLYLDYTSRQSVSGALVLRGAASNLLSLRSTRNGSGTYLLLDGDSGSQTIDYANVKDNNASGGQALVCIRCTNSGNNTNWIFPITGTVYADAGVTPIGAGHTVAVSVDGGTPVTTTTDASGNYQLNTVVNAGSVIAVYLTGTPGENGGVVSVSDGNANTVRYDIYKNKLIVRNDNGGSTTNANLATAAGYGDAQLAELYSVSAGTLTMGTDKTLLIPSGHTFAPGNTVNASNVTVQGTFAMSTNAVSVSGSWDSSSGTFTGANTVTFTGSGSIRRGSSSFNALVFNALNGKWTPISSLATAGNLTISAGTLHLSGSSLTVGGTFRNDGTLRMHGTETLTSVTNDTAHGGTVWYDGPSNYTGLNGFTSFANLTLSGAGTWSLNNAISTTGNVVLTSGTLLQKQKTISVGGSWTNNANFTSSGSMVFTGNGTITEPRGFKSVTVNAAGATVALGRPLTVSGSITITAGTLDVSAFNHTLTLSGSLTNNGGFNARAGAVVLNGGNQSVAGSSNTTFYNLTKSVSAAATLTFPAGATTAIQGAATLQGVLGQQLSLRSDTPGSKAPVNIGNAGRSISYVNVRDQNNGNSAVICDTGCTNALNNSGWSFPVSVNVYTDAGTTPAPDGTTVAFGLNGVLQTTADTVSGSARFTSVEVLPGDILTFWTSGESMKGATIVVSDAQQLSIPLYANALILRSEGASSITNADIADGTIADGDLASVYQVSGGNLTVTTPYTLIVPASSTFAPGGTVTTGNVDVRGTFAMASNAVSVSRNWNSRTGTFTGSNTVTFTGSGSIAKGSSSFAALAFNAANGLWTASGGLATTGNLTISNGKLSLSGASLTIGGTFRNDAVLQMLGSETLSLTNDAAHGGTVIFTGSSSYSGLDGITSFANLTISGSGLWTLNNDITVNGNHTITRGTLRQNQKTITVAGNWTDTGVFVGSGSTVFTSDATVTEPRHFGSVTVNAPAKTVTLASPLNVSGSIVLRGGTLDVGSNRTISLDGTWEKESGGAFTPGTGTVRLTGGNQTLSGSTTFHALSKRTSAAATLTFGAGTTQTVQGAWTMRGSVGNTLSLQSSVNGQQWSINPASYDLQYISVQGSDNTSGTTILAANDATNAGNNTGWAFPMVVTVVHRDGSAYTSGITVTAIVNDDAPVTSSTDGSGIATFNDGNPSHLVPNLDSGALLALHFSTGTETGSLITVTNGTSLGFTLYGNTLSVGAQNGSAITNSMLNTESGVLLSANLPLVYSMSGTSLVLNDGVRLRNADGRYAPGSKIYANDVSIAGTFEMGDDDVRVSGEWDATDGVFTADNTVYFTATGTENVISNGNYFHNVVFIVEDGSSAHWTFVDAFQYTGTVSIVNPSGSTDLFAPIVSDVTATAITETTARIVWRTNEASTEQVRYGTGSGLYYRSASGNGEDFNMTHVIFLTGLDPGTQYFFRAYSADEGDNVGSSAELSFTTLSSDTAPPVISSTATGSVTTTSAQITWNTDETATGAVLYGTAEDDLSSVVTGGSSYNMHHVLSMTSLTPGTEYFFKVRSTDASGNSAESSVFSFTTTGLDTTPPVISSTATGSLATTSVLITWNTNESATGAVLYGTAEDDLSFVVSGGGSYNMRHAVPVSGLAPGTGYFFKVRSTDAAGNSAESPVFSFTTLSSDTAPPVISSTATGSVTTTSAQITWNTDETATGAVLYGTAEDDLSSVVTGGSSYNMHHVLSMTSLTPGTEYFFKVRSTDASGNSAESSVFSFTTTGLDTTPPVISSTATGSLATTSVIISWQTDEVTTEVVNYGTDGGSLDQSATTGTNNMRHFIPITGLSSGTRYYYQVVSVDTSGNIATGDLLSFTTPSPDTTAPEVSDLAASLVTDVAAVLTWTTDEGAQSTVAFGTESGSLAGTTSRTSLDNAHYVILDGLSAGTPYYYQITSTDADGNSDVQSIASFTTRSELFTDEQLQSAVSSAVSAVSRGGGGGWRDVQWPRLSDVAIAALDGDSVTVTWNTDEPAMSLLKLGKDSTGERGAFDPSSLTGSLTHSVTVSHLSPGTTYKFVAISYDTAGNAGLSEEQTFTTPGPSADASSSSVASSENSSTSSLHPAPEEAKTGLDAFAAALEKTVSVAQDLKGKVDEAAYTMALRSGILTLRTIAGATLPAVFSSEPKVEVTDTTATITWTTDEPGNSLVSYGKDDSSAAAYVQTSGEAGADESEHSVTLHGLEPGTRYRYKARTVTILGTEAVSGDLVFTTSQSTVEILTFKAEVLSENSARFTWTTSAPTTSAVTVSPYLDGVVVPEQALRESDGEFGTEHSIVVRDLDPSTYYDADLWGTTPAGITVSKVINRFVTAKEGIPLEVTDIQTNAALLPGKDNRVQAVVTWNTNVSATSAVSFQKGIAVDGTGALVQVVPPLSSYTRKHVVLLPNLDPGTVYSFRVESRDSEGGSVTSRMYTILTPRQEESVFDIITRQIESLFGWLGNLRS